jgi:GTP-binding protein YchF
MKLGIIGLPRSGKSTVFEALTKSIAAAETKNEDRIATVKVPDKRLDTLKEIYKPAKTIHAQVEYFLPAIKKGAAGDQNVRKAVRDAEALIHVVRNHAGFGFEEKNPYDDFVRLDQELMLNDLVVVEKRLERLELDHQRGKKMNPEEHALLMDCRQNLENENPLRRFPQLSSHRLLKGFALLSAKPMLVIFNNEDDDDRLPQVKEVASLEHCLVVRAKLEQELAQMTPEETADFLSEFNIAASATDRVVQRSYALLNLISFFTVGQDEVRAWTIQQGTPAVDAAEVVHSDMKKGFIRAEVLSFDDLMATGSYSEARKKGTVRLEGKTYQVRDGDIITFRFNV